MKWWKWRRPGWWLQRNRRGGFSRGQGGPSTQDVAYMKGCANLNGTRCAYANAMWWRAKGWEDMKWNQMAWNRMTWNRCNNEMKCNDIKGNEIIWIVQRDGILWNDRNLGCLPDSMPTDSRLAFFEPRTWQGQMRRHRHQDQKTNPNEHHVSTQFCFTKVNSANFQENYELQK